MDLITCRIFGSVPSEIRLYSRIFYKIHYRKSCYGCGINMSPTVLSFDSETSDTSYTSDTSDGSAALTPTAANTDIRTAAAAANAIPCDLMLMFSLRSILHYFCNDVDLGNCTVNEHKFQRILVIVKRVHIHPVFLKRRCTVCIFYICCAVADLYTFCS